MEASSSLRVEVKTPETASVDLAGGGDGRSAGVRHRMQCHCSAYTCASCRLQDYSGTLLIPGKRLASFSSLNPPMITAPSTDSPSLCLCICCWHGALGPVWLQRFQRAHSIHALFTMNHIRALGGPNCCVLSPLLPPSAKLGLTTWWLWNAPLPKSTCIAHDFPLIFPPAGYFTDVILIESLTQGVGRRGFQLLGPAAFKLLVFSYCYPSSALLVW